MSIACTVVTPEKTEMKVDADSVVVPLFDGQLGILHGRAPMVGRLGFGLMKIKASGKESTYFVDGGFVQVTREGVYILTDRLLDPTKIDKDKAQSDFVKAMALPSNTPALAQIKERAVDQARAKVRLAG